MQDPNREILVRAMRPPSDDPVLQPLREVGSDTKTQHWDFEDIQRALRAANSRGIQIESLFAKRAATPRSGLAN